jgi:hypothetical protein
MQFEIRAEAYRRIEAALKEHGIAFPDNTPRVALYPAVAGEPVVADAPRLEQRSAIRRVWGAAALPPRSPSLRAVGKLVIGAIALMSALSSLGSTFCRCSPVPA